MSRIAHSNGPRMKQFYNLGSTLPKCHCRHSATVIITVSNPRPTASIESAVYMPDSSFGTELQQQKFSNNSHFTKQRFFV